MSNEVFVQPPTLDDVIATPNIARYLHAEEARKLMYEVLDRQIALFGAERALWPRLWDLRLAGGDRLLTRIEAAKMIGVNAAWLTSRGRNLPFVRRLSHKVVRYSEKGINAWLASGASIRPSRRRRG